MSERGGAAWFKHPRREKPAPRGHLFRSLLGTADINVGDADLDEVNRRIVSSILEVNTPKILVNVVRALVRSRLSYGLEAMPHLSKTGLARLTAIEVRGLRLALGLPPPPPPPRPPVAMKAALDAI